MASGAPILAVDNEMLRELIEPGINGALFRGSPVGLGQAIASLLDKPKMLIEWGEEGRAKLNPVFSHSKCLDKLEKIIYDISSNF